jgi:rhodanese-related sulfurtransferase
MGYRNVLWYRGGLESWKAAELPLVVPAATYPIK